VIDKANMGTFYRFVNGKLSCKSGVGPLKADCDKLILDTEKAERLNSYFISVITADDGNLPDFGRRVDESVFINHVEFTSLDLIKVITHVKSSKTADPQGFNNAFIKRLKIMLARPLCATNIYIFSSGKIPNSWHMENVTPVF